jgi:hypothetical protein
MDRTRLLRLGVACLLGVAVSVATAGGGSAAAGAAVKKKPRTACQKLVRGHKDLARSAKLVTVALGDDEYGRIAACCRVARCARWRRGTTGCRGTGPA